VDYYNMFLKRVNSLYGGGGNALKPQSMVHWT
jgi:hypothetical protein